MRFKSTILKDSVDQTVVCIGWTGNDEIIIGRFEKIYSYLLILNKYNIKLRTYKIHKFELNVEYLANKNHIMFEKIKVCSVGIHL